MSNTELQARDIDTLKSNVARLGAYVNANELIQTFGIARSTLLNQTSENRSIPEGYTDRPCVALGCQRHSGMD